jgi:hypothetical protein
MAGSCRLTGGMTTAELKLICVAGLKNALIGFANKDMYWDTGNRMTNRAHGSTYVTSEVQILRSCQYTVIM